MGRIGESACIRSEPWLLFSSDYSDELGLHSSLIATYNPHRVPTASMKVQACCLPRSSLDTLNFPLCFADSRSTSPGVKYGLYSMILGDVDDSGMLAVYVVV